VHCAKYENDQESEKHIQTRSAMQDLNSAAQTEENIGFGNASCSNDFEVNLIIQEFENEMLSQVGVRQKANMRERGRKVISRKFNTYNRERVREYIQKYICIKQSKSEKSSK